MQSSPKIHILSVTALMMLSNVGFATRINAQTYQIDCAILLCLSGGWPASVPCARARAEFIRRVTPWPIEPPLQIWRCPMSVSNDADRKKSGFAKTYEILSRKQDFPVLQSQPEFPASNLSKQINTILRKSTSFRTTSQNLFSVYPTQSRADIDISGPEFNFVRSIRVFNVRHASQFKAGSEGGCERAANIYIGTYGTQGDFLWSKSDPSALPSAHVGLNGWGENCPNIFHRSVFVEWRDYDGAYGFEQVNY